MWESIFPPAPSLHFEQYLLCQGLTSAVNQSTTQQRGKDSPDKDVVGAACTSDCTTIARLKRILNNPHAVTNQDFFQCSRPCAGWVHFFGSWFRNKTEILRHDVECLFQSPVLWGDFNRSVLTWRPYWDLSLFRESVGLMRVRGQRIQCFGSECVFASLYIKTWWMHDFMHP